ncbi:hypothetical protein MOQ_005560 [Trypanosoma cruzi marinkellei]|uniref:Uncharacterized protein n=1 Tax=Trypanosoma cruzi marinkellei TaxID=85056 RepID=K2MUB8_TRYCR|nr:hypothetical protein MOQ_005560 [Trypanosoma cruzi marinkellei]
MKEATREEEEGEAQPCPTVLSSSIMQEPFVQELIQENEAMLGEIARLRCLHQSHAKERCQHVQTAETAARQLLATSEAEERFELCVTWHACLLGGLRDTLEELEAMREENTALQKVMLKAQEELGALESYSSPVSSEGEITPARVITAIDPGCKLHAHYIVSPKFRANYHSPRVSFGPSRKRGRSSGDSWHFSPSEKTVKERGVSQQPI